MYRESRTSGSKLFGHVPGDVDDVDVDEVGVSLLVLGRLGSVFANVDAFVDCSRRCLLLLGALTMLRHVHGHEEDLAREAMLNMP